ncbi:AraC family transcriptional regulator [Aquimarina gracilis]|uniref:AraC family transcriptional regulator n=1 Tax=Aquimarina gracilis TaxID=874422 RepID=A0ABU6A1Y8_9FLAO|nr:AraC family transcriptional regulator [Aquimarina gracilis]MEB3348106.1 AraC family transcriptional regulator [Aquimarina gracilis]
MRRSHYICLFLFFLCFKTYVSLANPQNNNDIAQISKDKHFILTEKNTDSVKSFLLKILETNTILAETYYQHYLDRGITEKDLKIQFIAYYYLADIAYEKGDYPSSIEHGNAMVSISHKNNNTHQKIVAQNHLGNVYYQIREYELSLTHYLEAYKIYKKQNPKDLHLGILSNMNMIRTRIHQYEDALSSYKMIIRLLENKKNKNIPNYSGYYLSALLGAGVCNYRLEEYDQALSYYKKGLELTKKFDSEKHYIIFNMTIGEAYNTKGMYDLALDYLYEARNRIARNPKDSFDPKIHTNNLHLANVFFNKEQYQKTLNYLSESFEIIDKSTNEAQIEKINEMYDLAYRAAEKLENKELQLKYSNAYRRVIDSMHHDDIQTKDKLYDQDINTLKERNENLTSQNFLYITSTIIFTVGIIVLSVYHFKKQQKNKRLFEALQEKQNDKAINNTQNHKKEFVTDRKANVLLKRLKDIKETNFYLSEDCSLYNTSKLIDTNTTYLSKIINENLKKSFNEYINELRIDHCLTQLKHNKKFQSYTIKAIANELGYKSVNTFAAAFKKQTGISHSYYIKQILKEGKTDPKMNTA